MAAAFAAGVWWERRAGGVPSGAAVDPDAPLSLTLTQTAAPAKSRMQRLRDVKSRACCAPCAGGIPR